MICIHFKVGEAQHYLHCILEEEDKLENSGDLWKRKMKDKCGDVSGMHFEEYYEFKAKELLL